MQMRKKGLHCPAPQTTTGNENKVANLICIIIIIIDYYDGGNLPTGNTLLSMFESGNDTDSDEELIATDMAGEAIIASSSIEKGDDNAPGIGMDQYE